MANTPLSSYGDARVGDTRRTSPKHVLGRGEYGRFEYGGLPVFSVTVGVCPTLPHRPQRPRQRPPAMLQRPPTLSCSHTHSPLLQQGRGGDGVVLRVRSHAAWRTPTLPPAALSAASQRRRRRIASAPTCPSVTSSRRTVCGTSSCGRISGSRSASRGGGWRTSDRSAVTLGSA